MTDVADPRARRPRSPSPARAKGTAALSGSGTADRAPPRAFEANYVPAAMPEHRGNPLIEALPTFSSGWELISAFQQLPFHDEGERRRPASYRTSAVGRLRNFIVALDLHVEVISKILFMITAGYGDRNPLDPFFRREVVTLYRTPKGEVPVPLGPSSCPTAPSCALIGRSGLGKTVTVERSLAFLPQVLLHRTHGFAQIVHLKLECPPNGSAKQLMLGFVSRVDDLLGTDYAHAYNKLGADLLVLQVAKLATWHHVGLIVLDEAQRLLSAKRDVDYALAFLVYMTNTVRVPILMVGTTSSLPVMSGSFHQARRTGDHGTIHWERMQYGGPESQWGTLVREMIRFNWTRHHVVLSEDLSRALHEETLGIHALLIRLFMLCQLEVIEDKEELEYPITPELVREVARAKFKLLRRFLAAIEAGADTDNLEASYRAKVTTIDERMADALGTSPPPPPVAAEQEVRAKAVAAVVAMGECDEARALRTVHAVAEDGMDVGQVVSAAIRRLGEETEVEIPATFVSNLDSPAGGRGRSPASGGKAASRGGGRQ
jgi:hypothetical protein